ncbi:AAA family ATPase [Cystobacter fuscus]|uniref:AAA family ATPase n=1 Tax=Cystobacter fuscus TaxID=43 RepID=UPI002B2CC797|nr:AAA family ATPase [Cystobacter fuscus]
MGFELEVDNYRALRRIRWKAEGVCALVGPNGSGKTTLLSVLDFLGSAAVDGFGKALNAHGGAFLFRHRQAATHEPVRFAFTTGGVRWESMPSTSGLGVVVPVPERLVINQDVVAEQRAGEAVFRVREENKTRGDISFLVAVDAALPDDVSALFPLSALSGASLYSFEAFWQLKREGSREGTDVWLDTDGRNAFTVLRNWLAGKREHRSRWEWVRSGLRECFPDLFDDLDFAVAGQTVAAQFYGPGGGEPTPMHLAPNGLLMALLLLCAVASADEGIVCIDEPENGLHPYAIQRLISLMRERAEAHELTILLATHSPTLLNEFNDQPDHVFIMEPGQETLPVRLDQHQNPEWLRNFALGDLYMNQTIGPQVKPST